MGGIVVAYDRVGLRDIIAVSAGIVPEWVETKPHFSYLASYLEALNVATVLTEGPYIDRDFLEDYAGYYVRCFHEYKRKCVRLHFFNRDFSDADLEALLSGLSSTLTWDQVQQSYLGFVVIKPLPETVIGRTCLRTYDDTTGGRHYPIKRPYKVHLFGRELTIDSLAFQEQDHVVAACATSALWSIFHGTGMLFQHAIPSPVEITKAANVHFSSNSRNLPNYGLTVEQMANAVRGVGLEPLAVAIQDEEVFKTTLYGYLRGRVPLLMGIRLYDISASPATLMGLHAIAVTGFRIGDMSATSGPAPSSGLSSIASSIDRIYVHDDGIGPFARMLLDGTSIIVDGCSCFSISTSWRTDSGVEGKVRAVPEVLLVPLYHKIRIPFELVQKAIIHFDAFLHLFQSNGFLPFFSSRLCWDVRLSTVNDFKSDVLGEPMINAGAKLEAVTASLPRFLWRATARHAGSLVLDLLFDATDIEQGSFFVRAVEYHQDLSLALRAFAKVPEACKCVAPAGWPILRHFGSL